MRICVLIAVLLCVAAGMLPAAQTDPALNIVFIDVEGGQATLIVSPGGESMLVDAGYPGFDDRDADRIAAEAKRSGVHVSTTWSSRTITATTWAVCRR